MGDPAQLPPVMDSSKVSAAVQEADSPIFALPGGVELTEVQRYEGAIAEYVTAIRQDLRVPAPELQTTGNITRCRSAAWEAQLIEAFRSVDLEAEPNKVRALAWTNKRMAAINEVVRAEIFGYDVAPFLRGERLIAKEPTWVMQSFAKQDEDGQTYQKQSWGIQLNSCQECTVHAISTFTDDMLLHVPVPNESYRVELLKEVPDSIRACLWAMQTIDCYRLEVVTDCNGDATIRTPTVEELPRLWSLLKDWLKAIKEESDGKIRSRQWRSYFLFLEKYNLVVKNNTLLYRLQYAYAMTVHQSQGSTYEHVFVDASNIYRQRNLVRRNKLLYTACTRASKHLTVLMKY
jgi:hypothetical protein